MQGKPLLVSTRIVLYVWSSHVSNAIDYAISICLAATGTLVQMSCLTAFKDNMQIPQYDREPYC